MSQDNATLRAFWYTNQLDLPAIHFFFQQNNTGHLSPVQSQSKSVLSYWYFQLHLCSGEILLKCCFVKIPTHFGVQIRDLSFHHLQNVWVAIKIRFPSRMSDMQDAREPFVTDE